MNSRTTALGKNQNPEQYLGVLWVALIWHFRCHLVVKVPIDSMHLCGPKPVVLRCWVVLCCKSKEGLERGLTLAYIAGCWERKLQVKHTVTFLPLHQREQQPAFTSPKTALKCENPVGNTWRNISNDSHDVEKANDFNNWRVLAS